MAGESIAGKPPEPHTSKEKLLFYTTAFFILLGIFSLFGFLFLVPFVIEPAFTTIFAAFDLIPAECVTRQVEMMRGASNCSWTSCREGCTREIYECTQIRVNYKVNKPPSPPPQPPSQQSPPSDSDDNAYSPAQWEGQQSAFDQYLDRSGRSIREYDYPDVLLPGPLGEELLPPDDAPPSFTGLTEGDGTGNDSEWFFVGAKLFPNVKGCGYPPMLNCTVFYNSYSTVGTNFSCFYSTVDPGIVITHLDMLQVYRHLIYALAIPIPSFIAAVVYLTLAYLYIYSSDDSPPPPRPPRKKPPLILGGATADAVEATPLAPQANSSPSPNPPPTTGALTPASEVFRDDMASFGHQLKVAMADDFLSGDSIGSMTFANSTSMNG